MSQYRKTSFNLTCQIIKSWIIWHVKLSERLDFMLFLTILIWHVKLSERLGFPWSKNLTSSIFWLSVTSWARIYRFYCIIKKFSNFEKIHDIPPFDFFQFLNFWGFRVKISIKIYKPAYHSMQNFFLYHREQEFILYISFLVK